MFLGAIVIVIVGVVAIKFFAKRQGETIPPIEVVQDQNLLATHTVAQGEDLWSISERYYGTGYNWVDIARENNLSNPNEIEVGQVLRIPVVQKEEEISSAETPSEITSTPTPEVVATQPERESESEAESKHKVEPNESLWKIAEKYFKSGYNWIDIAERNKLANANVIRVGQELIIPKVQPRKITVVESQTTSSNEAITGDTYTVQKGDSLWKIAVRAYGDGYRWVDIAKKNDLKNPNIIHPGNLLNIPR